MEYVTSVVDRTHGELADKAMESYTSWLRKMCLTSTVDNALSFVLSTVTGQKIYGDIPGRDLPMAARVLALRS